MDIQSHNEQGSNTIRQLSKEIGDNINKKIGDLKRKINALREKMNHQERMNAEEHFKLTKAVEEAKELNHCLIGRRTALQQHNIKDEEEIKRLEKDNQDLNNQIKELQVINKTLNDKVTELNEKYNGLFSKYSYNKEKYDTKIKQQKDLNHNYRTILGINMIRIRDNCIKVIFYNLPSECYVLIDFNNPDCVIECNPVISLEKLNFIFKEAKCFYKFIKYIRGEFKKLLQ